MINFSAVDFAYSRRKPLFKALDLSIEKGRTYGLLGKNGSGKSTLLKLACGVLIPSSGAITTLGVTPSKRLPSMLGNIYYLPEEVYSPKQSMRHFAKSVGALYPRFSFAMLEHYMAEFELDMNQKLDRQSLGQKKKAAIAFALACNTELLVMDEPTNGLDIPSKSQFRRIISNLDQAERTIIISTHQVRDLENILDSVIVLDESRILLNTSIDNIESSLHFGRLVEGQQAIYEESSLAMRTGVTASADGEYNKVDIEMLFNAVTTCGAEISKVLNSKTK